MPDIAQRIGFNAPKTSKKFSDATILASIKAKIQVLGKISSVDLNTTEAQEITFEGTDLIGIVLEIANEEGIQPNVITYLTLIER